MSIAAASHNLPEQLAEIEGQIRYLEGQRDLLKKLIGSRKPSDNVSSPTQSSSDKGNSSASKEGGKRVKDPRVSNMIYRVVENNPGKYSLAELAREASSQLGIDEGDKDKRMSVYNVAHGLVRRKQFRKADHNKKLYPVAGAWDKFKGRNGE